MLIGELSKKTNVSRDTIRFYEKLGLIKANKKARRANNYREYHDSDLERLQLIILLKEYGFTLSDIKSIMNQMEDDRNEAYKDMPGRIEARLLEIELKMQELLGYKQKLAGLLKEFKKP
jgi:MerR family copper efflux transcriptional regulator